MKVKNLNKAKDLGELRDHLRRHLDFFMNTKTGNSIYFGEAELARVRHEFAATLQAAISRVEAEIEEL